MKCPARQQPLRWTNLRAYWALTLTTPHSNKTLWKAPMWGCMSLRGDKLYHNSKLTLLGQLLPPSAGTRRCAPTIRDTLPGLLLATPSHLLNQVCAHPLWPTRHDRFTSVYPISLSCSARGFRLWNLVKFPPGWPALGSWNTCLTLSDNRSSLIWTEILPQILTLLNVWAQVSKLPTNNQSTKTLYDYLQGPPPLWHQRGCHLYLLTRWIPPYITIFLSSYHLLWAGNPTEILD